LYGRRGPRDNVRRGTLAFPFDDPTRNAGRKRIARAEAIFAN